MGFETDVFLPVNLSILTTPHEHLNTDLILLSSPVQKYLNHSQVNICRLNWVSLWMTEGNADSVFFYFSPLRQVACIADLSHVLHWLFVYVCKVFECGTFEGYAKL